MKKSILHMFGAKILQKYPKYAKTRALPTFIERKKSWIPLLQILMVSNFDHIHDSRKISTNCLKRRVKY